MSGIPRLKVDSRRGIAPKLELIDESYTSIKTEMSQNQESTISFPSHTRSVGEVPKLRSEMIANDEVLVGLRRQVDSENRQSREFRQMLLAVTSFRQMNLQTMSELRKGSTKSSTDGPRILDDYHRLVIDQMKSVSQTTFGTPEAQSLMDRMTVLKTEIESESQSREHSRNEEIERIRGKSRFYRREIDQLEEFIRKEMEFEQAEDEATISCLEQTIQSISNEITSAELALAKKKERDNALSLASFVRRLQQMKSEIAALGASLTELTGLRAQYGAGIQLQTETNLRLESELSGLSASVYQIPVTTTDRD
jgi:hypothetical protein